LLGNIKIGTKLIGGFMIVLLLLVVSAVMSYTNMQTAKTNQDSLYADRLIPVNQLGEINGELYAIRGDLYKLEVAPEEIGATEATIRTSISFVTENVTAYKASKLLAAETIALADFEKNWATYLTEVEKDIALAKAANWTTFKTNMMSGGSTSNARKAVDTSIVTLGDINLAEADRLDKASDAKSSSSTMITIVLAVVSIIFGVAIALVLSKSITGPINKVKNALAKMAVGDINEKLNITSKDEVGMMAQAYGEMQLYMQETAGAAQQIAAGDLNITVKPKSEHDVLRNAFDKVVVTLKNLVADAGMLSKAAVEGKLATRADATKHQGDYRKIVEGVNQTLDAVIGPLNVAAKYVDDISKGNIPAKIVDKYNGDFNNIKNNLNQCIDAVNKLVEDAGMLSKAAVEGKLATRADATKHQGDFRKIVQGVDDCLDAVIGPLNVAAKYVDDISKGNIPAKITDSYNGDFNNIKNNLNQCIDAVNKLVGDAGILSKAAVEGKLATRADATKHQGDFRKIVEGVNQTLDAVIGPLNVAAKYVDDISKGNIPAKISDTYNGDFNNIKNNLNQCIDAVNNLVADAGVLSKAAVEGKLATRADATKHWGDFRKVVEGVNQTLDAVIGPLNVAAKYVDDISKGNIPAKISDTYNGDFNTIKNNLNQCIDAVNKLVEDAGMLSKAAVEGKLATRADATKHQGDFRKIVQGVDDCLDAVIGPLNVAADYVDKISKGNIPAKIVDKYNGDFNNIKNNLNQCIDAVNKLVEDAGMLSKAAVEGKLATRADATKHQGDFRKIVQGVDDCLDAVIGPLNVAAKYVDDISKGNIPAKITDSYNGDFNNIKNNLNQCIDAVNKLVGDAGILSKAAVEGKLATRADASKHQGDFRKVVEGVNQTLDAVIGPLNVAAKYVDDISKGDIPAKITDTYNGDFNTIKNNLNQCIDAVNRLVGDAGMLSKAAEEGRLATRADATKHQGDFRLIVEGVNHTLDAVIGPVNDAAAVLDKLAANDLTVKVTADYKGDHAKIKNSLNKAIDSLTELVIRIKKNADGMTEASKQLSKASDQAGQATQQIAATSQQVAKGASEQSTSLQGTTRAMEQLSSAIEQISKGAQEQTKGIEKTLSTVKEVSASVTQVSGNAKSATAGATESASSARLGAEKAKQTVDGMEKIKIAIGVASQRVTKLGEQSGEIDKIVATIDDIAAQTNLLALNAAIEAARAGEQGRGFAVVADEVRKLAERSLGATKEIADLISGIQKGVSEAVKAMEDGNKEIEGGYKLAADAGASLNEILKQAETVGTQVQQISQAAEGLTTLSGQLLQVAEGISAVIEENTAATEQMAASSDQVSKSVESVAGVAEENGAATEQVSASAQEMSAQVEQVVASAQSLSQMADELTKAVGVFKLDGKDLAFSRN